MRHVATVLAGVTLATLAGLLCGFSPLGLTGFSAGVSLAIGLALALLPPLRGQGGSRSVVWVRPSFPQVCSAALFAAFVLRAFPFLLFDQGDSIRVLSPNNLGDICLHLTQINFLAANPPFWPDNPIFAFDKLRYPLGINLFNAELKLVGVGTQLGLISVALTGAALTGIALWRFGGAFATVAFLCNGGLIGFRFLETFAWRDYQADVAWKSIPLAMFVTQRGLLYAFPAGLALLWSWRHRLFERAPERALPFATELLLYASLPLFHLHTFLFLSVMLAWWFLFGERAWRPAIARLVGAALVPATTLVFFVTGFEKTGALGWHPGWMQAPLDPPWRFWLVNFGVWLPLTGALVGFLCRPQADATSRKWRLWALPATLVFGACALFRFAPWEWDNTKLMCWSYLVLAVALEEVWLSRWSLRWRLPVTVALFFSGFVSLVGGLVAHPAGYEIGDRSEWAAVAEALRDTPANAVYAGYPTYNHPVLVTGHRMVMGFPGHLWSHGLNYRPVEVELKDLLLGRPGWQERARRLGVDYVFWGSSEEEEYPDSARPWEGLCPTVAEGDWGVVYDVRGVVSGGDVGG